MVLKLLAVVNEHVLGEVWGHQNNTKDRSEFEFHVELATEPGTPVLQRLTLDLSLVHGAEEQRLSSGVGSEQCLTLVSLQDQISILEQEAISKLNSTRHDVRYNSEQDGETNTRSDRKQVYNDVRL
jgi:hypothetical protein